jgi:hypothetical protein
VAAGHEAARRDFMGMGQSICSSAGLDTPVNRGIAWKPCTISPTSPLSPVSYRERLIDQRRQLELRYNALRTEAINRVAVTSGITPTLVGTAGKATDRPKVMFRCAAGGTQNNPKLLLSSKNAARLGSSNASRCSQCRRYCVKR